MRVQMYVHRPGVKGEEVTLAQLLSKCTEACAETRALADRAVEVIACHDTAVTQHWIVLPIAVPCVAEHSTHKLRQPVSLTHTHSHTAGH